MTTRPTIRQGDEGEHVVTLQECLSQDWTEVVVDGDFGPVTDKYTREFQRDEDLEVDGIVGPMTWDALEITYDLPPYIPPKPIGLPPPLSPELVKKICDLAMSSPAASYNWGNRGMMPPGYTKGMCLAWAGVVRRWHRHDSAAVEMAKANTHNSDKDALSWYAGKFDALGMNNDHAGLSTLRHLWVLLHGLGPQESSGRHCEGRDQSVPPGYYGEVSVTTEAGMFQTSWDVHPCCDEIQKLFDTWAPSLELDDGYPQCYLEVFREGVSCSASEWECYGSGDGYSHQELSKACPPYHAEMTAIGLRNLRQHWGPINRYEAQLNKDVDELYLAVEALLAEEEAIA